MSQDLLDTDDVRHISEGITDVAAAIFGLQAVGFEPMKGLPLIDPGDVVLGIVIIFALVSALGTFHMIQEDRL